MSGVRLIDETFARDPAFYLQRYARRTFGTFQEKPVGVVLQFDASVARDAPAFLFHRDQSIEENADDSLTVCFTAGGIDEMCWHLITWGGSVTVWTIPPVFADGSLKCAPRLQRITESTARMEPTDTPDTPDTSARQTVGNAGPIS